MKYTAEEISEGFLVNPKKRIQLKTGEDGYHSSSFTIELQTHVLEVMVAHDGTDYIIIDVTDSDQEMDGFTLYFNVEKERPFAKDLLKMSIDHVDGIKHTRSRTYREWIDLKVIESA